ncbi:MAG: carbohydrate ABC transporter permease [Clostridia bacterium]|nr:carbohydrate ABC transporter permease [Clostridia bacterium]
MDIKLAKASARSNRIRATRADRIFVSVNIFIMLLILFVIIYPLWFVVIASFSDSQLVAVGKVLIWPKGFHVDAYRKVFSDSRIMTGYRNTIFYTFAGTFLNVVFTMSLAYPLSRRDFVGRNFIMGIMSVTMFFGGGLIPTYLVYKQLGIVNSVWVMILPGLVSVYNCILMRTFIQGLPYELQEAAMIDGCGNMGMLLKITLPLCKPIIAVMVIYYGVSHWNSYFNALIYISNKKLKPLALILREILITNSTTASEMESAGSAESEADMRRVAEAIKYAVIIVSTFPMLCLYPFAQKYFAKGVMLGAIKG